MTCKKFLVVFIFFAINSISSYGQLAIASDGLNNTSTLFTLNNGAYYTGNSAAGERPANSPFSIEGSHSRGIVNGSATLTSSDINTSAYSNILASFRLASFSINVNNNGADGADIVTVEVSPDGGVNYYSTVRVLGNNNACWEYSTGTGVAATAYDGNTTPVDFSPSGGGIRTTDGYSAITITGLPAVTNLRVRITMLNDSANEQWVIDDFKIQAAYSTRQDGPWYDVNTWTGFAIPTNTGDVVINHAVTNVTSGSNISRGTKSTTINLGASLSTGAFTYTSNGITTVDGTFQIETGGWATGTANFTYGTSGTLNFNKSGSAYTVNNGDVFWPSSNSPVNVNVLQGGLIMNSASRTVSGIFTTAAGVTLTSSVLTLNGTCQINANGFFNNAPKYGGSSTLIYNTGGSFNLTSEWTGNSTTAGTGIPQNVTIQNSTTVNMPNSDRGMAGNLNITSGGLTLDASSGDFYLAGNWTRASAASFTPRNRAVFFYGSTTQTVTISASGTETFNYLLVQGSGTLKLATNTNILVDASSGLTLASSNATSTIDLNGQTLTLSGGGNLSLSGGARKITSSVASGSLSITSNQVTITNGGTLSTETNTLVKLQNALNSGTGSLLTINGTLQINSGGSCTVNSPKYGSNSLLQYNTNGPFTRSLEWTSNTAAIGTAGYPNNVQISNNTTLNYYNSSYTGAKGMNGNFVVDSGSAIDFGTITTAGALSVAGNVTNAGTITLGVANGDDLKTAGNYANTGTGTFNGNNRAIWFTKAGTQTVSSITALTIPYVVTSGGGTTVQLLCNVSIPAALAGNAIVFGNAADLIDMNGFSVSIGTSGVNNIINGSGKFKGNTSSDLTLLGNGSIGTLSFVTDFNLRNFTMNRQAATVGCVMGSAVTINNSLALTNGIIDLATNSMTLENGVNPTGSANSYIIADVNSSEVGGKLTKSVSAGGSHTFPIGDGTSSANGTQYTPATVNFTAGTFDATSYLTIAVNDNKESNLIASTDYLTRYWSLTTVGTFTNPIYTFTGTYSTTSTQDVTGTIGTYFKSNQWNGSDWTNGGTMIAGGVLTKTGCTDVTAINHITAGNRDQEIEVKGGATIVSGATTTSGLNNTAFGTKILASNTANTFTIHNRGGVNLSLTGSPTVKILPSSSSADFVVTTLPAITTIGAESSTTFVITFTPSYAGYRTATVSIDNNDSNENPYTFVVDGTGDCSPVPSNTITPASGPYGTEVTITATANSLTSASATFNGSAVTVTQIDATHITTNVPNGAVSGNFSTTNSVGCIATNYFTVIDNAIVSCQGAALGRNKIFISEVSDHGSGQHSYVELYNATGSTVNLLNYEVRIHNNGSATPTGTITLPSYNLLNNSVYVISFGGSDASSNPGGATVNFTSGVSGINNDDNVRLYNPSGTWIDLWGDTSGAVFTVASKDYNYRRKNTGITAPSTTWSASDWTAFTPVNYSDIGFYNFSSTGTLPAITAQPSYTPTCKATTLSVTATEGYNGVGDTKELVYQWYAAPNGSSTWNLISDGGIYSGALTNALYISNISTIINYQFYCQVSEDSSTCFIATNAIKITSGLNTTWQVGNTWSNGVPTINMGVTIDNDYDTANVISPSFEACSLTINNGKTVTIRANNYANIQNDLTVSLGGNLIVENNGSIVMIDNNGIVTNNGTTQIKRTAAGIRGFDYVYWSSPVTGQSIDNLYSSPSPGEKFKWNPLAPNINSPTSSGTWQLASGTMAPATGYIVRGSSYFGMTASSIPSVFTGAVNSGIVPVTISRGSYQGANYSGTNTVTVTKFDDNWNLIGNPYPSSIKALDFLTYNTNIQGFIYLWTHGTAPVSTTNPFYNSFLYNYTSNDYITYNGTATTSGPSGFNGYIASGQGFFVLMNDGATGAQTVNFKNSMRSKTYANSQFYKTAENIEEKHRIWLDLVDSNNQPVRTVVGYVPEATMELDRLYDAYKNTANEMNIYSLAENETLIIQGRSLPFDVNDQVPIGVTIKSAGTYKIAIGAVDGLFSETTQSIYLEDKLLGIIYDLRQNPYTFDSDIGIFNERFVLRYTNSALGNPVFGNIENSVVVAANHGELTIKSSIENIQEVTVYDVLGRQLFYAKSISNNNFVASNISISQQALIVKIKLANGVIVTRKIIL